MNKENYTDEECLFESVYHGFNLRENTTNEELPYDASRERTSHYISEIQYPEIGSWWECKVDGWYMLQITDIKPEDDLPIKYEGGAFNGECCPLWLYTLFTLHCLEYE